MNKLLRYEQIFEAGTQSVVDQVKSNAPVGGYKSKEEVFGKPEEKKNSDIRVKYSKDLEELLKVLEDENSYIAFELLW